MSLVAAGNSDPGKLDRRVELHYPITARDAAGGETVTWFVAASVWARKEFLRAGRMYAADAKHFESGLTYRIRTRPDVSEGWRLVHGDDVYEITGIEEQGRAHFSELSVRGIDQDSGSALRGLLLHDGTPFALHGDNSYLLLHREQDAA